MSTLGTRRFGTCIGKYGDGVLVADYGRLALHRGIDMDVYSQLMFIVI